MPSPYAVPLADLAAVRVPVSEQVTEQATDRTEHLPGNPVLWTMHLVPPVADGGGG